MRYEAQNVKPGDRVRGIGLVVEYSEPHSDFLTALVGQVSSKTDPAAGYDGTEYVQTQATIIVPNNHLVNVVRSDENFHADRVAAVQAALDAYNEGSSDDEYLGQRFDVLAVELERIASMPRGRNVWRHEVRDLLAADLNADLNGGTSASADELLAKVDALSFA